MTPVPVSLDPTGRYRRDPAMAPESTPRGGVPPLPLSQHVVRHLRPAVPVMLSRAGPVILFSVDSIMTGRAGASQLAHGAIALAPRTAPAVQSFLNHIVENLNAGST